MNASWPLTVLNFDYRVFKILNSLAGKSKVWDAVFVIAAEYVLYAMIVGLVVFILFKEKDRSRWIAALHALAAAFIGRVVIVSFIRIFFFRARPFVEAEVHRLVNSAPLDGSFPSSHATVMFALAFSLFFANIRWGLAYLGIAMVSSVARVIVGVHFPLDITGGMLVGALSAIVMKLAFDVWLTKKKAAKIRLQ